MHVILKLWEIQRCIMVCFCMRIQRDNVEDNLDHEEYGVHLVVWLRGWQLRFPDFRIPYKSVDADDPSELLKLNCAGI